MMGLLEQRSAYCDERLGKLRSAISRNANIPNLEDLCVYVTGSFGRGEASPHSDLDLFFLNRGTVSKHGLTNRDKALLFADLIRVVEDLCFPPLTKGGAYLKIHYLDDVLDSIGSQTEDFENSFTARMLLLTESTAVLNAPMFDAALRKLIDVYFRDYHDHEKEFRPIFLINDIVRYWKTMCMNYEHNRHRTDDAANDDPAGIQRNKNKAHTKNFKLKFSRMLTCFSFVIACVAQGRGIGPENVENIARKTPLQRLDWVAQQRPQAKEMVEMAKAEYAWFLEKTGCDSGELEAWISNREVRNTAFDKGRTFGATIYRLLSSVTEPDTLRYLVV